MKRTLLALTLLAAPAAALAVPAQLTTQGRVLDADAAPVDDTVAVTFRLMDSESGGTTLWEETQSVAFTNGFYSVMLGTDEEANPLEDSVLDQWPLYLEVQLDGEGPMFPRMSVGSVPYARQAGIAEELAAGADIDAGSLTVNGTEVVTADGAWTGATPDVDWSDLTGIPGDFADEDDADTLANLVCSDGQWAVWDDDSAAWGCDGFSDTTLTDPDVVLAVGTDVVDLYAGSTMDGYTLLTEDSELAWANLMGIPSGLDDGDDDTLGGLSCAGSQVAAWDAGTLSWACATDDTLSYSEVAMAVEAASTLSLPAATDVGGSPVITTSDTVDWSQLTAVPTGLADGDDDTLAATSCADGEVMVYSTTSGSWGCGTDTDTTLTVPQVQAAVESIVGIALAAGAMVDGDAVLTETSVVDAGAVDASAASDGQVLTAEGGVASWIDPTSSGCSLSSSGGGSVSLDCGGTVVALQASLLPVDLAFEYYDAATVTADGRVHLVGETGSGSMMHLQFSGGTPEQLALNEYVVAVLYSDGSVEVQARLDGYRTTAAAIEAGLSGTYIEVVGGGEYICTLNAAGAVTCADSAGTITSEATSGALDLTVYSDHGCLVDSSGDIQCWGVDDYGEAVSVSGPFVEVATGQGNTCATDASGTISCWGGSYASINSPPSGSGYNSLIVGNRHACALDASGVADCWGATTYNLLLTPNLELDRLVTGAESVCGESVGNGRFYCWGRAYHGLLDLPL